MKIIDLIRLVENRLATLNASITTAFNRGDFEVVSKLEEEVFQTEETLETLRDMTQ